MAVCYPLDVAGHAVGLDPGGRKHFSLVDLHVFGVSNYVWSHHFLN